MSSHSEIIRTHKAETKFKLRPHLVADPAVEPAAVTRDESGRLCVALRDLLTEPVYLKLKAMGLIA